MRKDLPSLEEKMEEARRLVEFGHYLQEMRQEKEESLAVVGEALNVSSNYLSELERGKKMPSDVMIRDIAEYFKVEESILFNKLGKIPLLALEELEENEDLQKTLIEIKRNKKLTEDQKGELYERIHKLYLDFANEEDN
jgi:transcriptional regulator with XRE-family HTH domain